MSVTQQQTTHGHPPLVWFFSGHQQVMDLLIVHFKVAHLYMTFDLRFKRDPNRSFNYFSDKNEIGIEM